MQTNRTREPMSAVAAAWLSLLLFAPSFFAAFLVGEGLIAAMGYDVGEAAPPSWAQLLATVPAILVFAIPLWPTWHFGRKVGRRRGRSAMGPFFVALVAVVSFAAINLVPLGW
jgi:hypothetical protein